MKTFDAIVLGTGGVGSAAMYHLARRGLRVVGIDRFGPAHDRGSSHGETRIIRQAYFEHPDYVPLLLHAYDLWAELERETTQLFHQVGLLQVGPADGVVIPGVLASARLHQLDVEPLRVSQLAPRFAGFRLPEGMTAVYERKAGYLLIERCVLAHLTLAKRHGAEHRTGEVAVSWGKRGGGVFVLTDHAEYHAAKLVIAAGPWAPQVLLNLGVPLVVKRKNVYWFRPRRAEAYEAALGCPTFLYELPHGVFYGFPALASGLKAAEHSGGEVVSDPLAIDRSVDAKDARRVSEFINLFLTEVDPSVYNSSICFYTMTPDEHFVVDVHPENRNVAFAAGLSGHGFKFTGVLGQVLADLSTEGVTGLPIGFLRLDRPALRGTPPKDGET